MLRALTAHLGRRPCAVAESLRPLGIMNFATKASSTRPDDDRSVFIGNLPHTWTEDDVRTSLQLVGPIEKVHMGTDRETKKFRGFAFVQFVDPSDAANAIQFGASLGKKRFVVKPIAPTAPKSSTTSLPKRVAGDKTPIIYFGNLPIGGSEDEVLDLFSKFGTIKEVLLVKDSTNQSRGYGSVEFEDASSVDAALALAGRTDVTLTERNRPLIVKLPHQRKLNVPSTVVLLKALSSTTTEADVEAAIAATGAKVAHVHLHKDKDTKEFKGTGYVILHDTDSVKKATKVNEINDVEVKIVAAQEKVDMARTLYVGNLPHTVTEEEIRDLFATCGPIYQVRLAQLPGSTRVYAHVQYASGASMAAARRMVSPTIGGRKLYLQVALDE